MKRLLAGLLAAMLLLGCVLCTSCGEQEEETNIARSFIASYENIVDMGGGSAYSVMSEGGALTPGIYMIQAVEGNGFVYVPCKDAGGEVDFMIGVDGGYIDSINYVKLNEGDNVIIEGCTVMFIEMKEG